MDLSGHSNQASLEHSAAVVPDTHFESGGAEGKKAGLLNTVANVQGFVDLSEGGADEGVFGKVGLSDDVMTLAPEKGDGKVAYSFLVNTAQYNPGGQVGQMLAFTVTGEGAGVLVKGTVMAQGAFTTTADGTARELGAVAAGKAVYAALHVLEVDGTTPTLDVIIESDDSEDFDGSESTQITFDQMTDVGAQLKSKSGPTTDTWWRVGLTIGGTNPSFAVAVVIGIK